MKFRYYGLIALAAFGLFLRQVGRNAQISKEMTTKLVAADMAGQDTNARDAELKDFVYSHMQADTSFKLEGAYQRDTDLAIAAAQPGTSGELYADAQRACNRGSSIVQSECVRNYVGTRLKPVEAKNLNLPKEESYRYSLHSPAWAPDLAGLSLLACVIALLLGVWTRLFHPKRKRL